MSTTSQNEAYTRSSSVREFTIPAGQPYSFSHYGERFYLVQCTGEVEIATDQMPFKPYRKGTGEQFVPEFRFKRVEVRNNNTFDIYCKIWVGFGEYIDTTAEVTEQPSEIVSDGDTNIPANSGITLNPTRSVSYIKRKAVTVTNGDNTSLRIELRDKNGFAFTLILPGETALYPTDGPIQVYNPNGSPVRVVRGSIYELR